MTAAELFLTVLAATSAIPLLILAAVILVLLVCWLLVFVQQWKGRRRWRARAQDLQACQRAARAAHDCRYDPRLFRGRR